MSVIELGRCRYFRSVGIRYFFKVGIGIDVGILKYRGIGIGITDSPLVVCKAAWFEILYAVSLIIPECKLRQMNRIAEKLNIKFSVLIS